MCVDGLVDVILIVILVFGKIQPYFFVDPALGAGASLKRRPSRQTDWRSPGAATPPVGLHVGVQRPSGARPVHPQPAAACLRTASLNQHTRSFFRCSRAVEAACPAPGMPSDAHSGHSFLPGASVLGYEFAALALT